MKTEEFVAALKQKPSCISSEAMFTDQMRVAFPNEPNERRLLVALYRVGIVSAIKNAPAIDDAFRLKFKKMIVATYRIADEAAMAAVDLWCDGYGRGILQKGIVKEYSATVVRQPTPTSSNAGSGTASFSLCPFSIMLPTTTITAKAILVRFSVNFKSNANAGLALDCGKITDSLRNVFQANPDNAYIPLKGGHPITFEIATPDRKPIWTNARITLQLLSGSGTKYDIRYKCDINRNIRLEDVQLHEMTEADEIRNKQIIANAAQKTTVVSASPGAPASSIETHQPEYAPSFSTPTLEQLKNALLQEMYYLKNNGGRKYKVTNGVRINDNKNGYPYRFELEAELNLADDSPITLTIGAISTSGNVLVCDGFELVVTIEKDLGSKVSLAYLSVEPWKLLEAQVNKLATMTQNDRLAIKLLRDGPKLATKASYLKIPQGQTAAKEKAASEDITVIWGPPGTGKTHTMAEITIAFLKQGKKVLAVSHSNVSVDGIVKKLAELMRKAGMEQYLKDGKILRYGYVRDPELQEDRSAVAFNYALDRNPRLKKEREDLLHEKDKLRAAAKPDNERQLVIEKRLKDIRAEVRSLESQYVGNAQFVATTISKVTIDTLFEYRKYDVVMFDEVSMAYVSQLLCAATYAKEHFIAVGDFRQLAPIAQSDARRILERDIFSYLQISTGGREIFYHPWLVMLDEQRRMHPAISEFASKNVYNALLKDHPSVVQARRAIAQRAPLAGQAMGLIDLSGTYCASAKNSDNSRLNILSAILSFSTALTAEKNGSDSVGIITPYAAQTRLIRAMLKDYNSGKNKTEVACSTVHQFQGSERDVIVFDAVESYPAQKVGWLMSRDENGHVTRLINVAITRARGKLITVANSQFWEKRFAGSNHTFYQLLRHLKAKSTVVNLKDKKLENYTKSLYTGKNIRYYPMGYDTYYADFKKDVENAHEKIVASIPDGHLKEGAKDVLELLAKAKKDGIHLYVKSNDYTGLPKEWQAYCWGSDDAVFPLIMIDDRVIWYGLPDAAGVFRDGNDAYGTGLPMIYRITGEHTIEMIKSLSGLENRTIDKNVSALTEKTAGERYLPQQSAIDKPDDGRQADGLAAFVKENSKCTKCGEPMELKKSRSGKVYLKCPSCDEMAYLTPELTNWYINTEHVRCPIHGCDLMAKVGPYGIYIRCDRGHYLKPDEI